MIESAAGCIESLYKQWVKLHERFETGVRAYSTDEDIIECPYCSFDIADCDELDEYKPKHCPNCGTKLIY